MHCSSYTVLQRPSCHEWFMMQICRIFLWICVDLSAINLPGEKQVFWVNKSFSKIFLQNKIVSLFIFFWTTLVLSPVYFLYNWASGLRFTCLMRHFFGLWCCLTVMCFWQQWCVLKLLQSAEFLSLLSSVNHCPQSTLVNSQCEVDSCSLWAWWTLFFPMSHSSQIIWHNAELRHTSE